MKTCKTNGVLLRNRQIYGDFTVIRSSENMLVAVMLVAVIVIVEPYWEVSVAYLMCRLMSWV